jgi:hypothetical protein
MALESGGPILLEFPRLHGLQYNHPTSNVVDHSPDALELDTQGRQFRPEPTLRQKYRPA